MHPVGQQIDPLPPLLAGVADSSFFANARSGDMAPAPGERSEQRGHLAQHPHLSCGRDRAQINLTRFESPHVREARRGARRPRRSCRFAAYEAQAIGAKAVGSAGAATPPLAQ
jgi:hypothetical protein